MTVDKIKVIKFMARKGFNYTQLAKESGVSRYTINVMLNVKQCKILTMAKIALALGVELEDILITD